MAAKTAGSKRNLLVSDIVINGSLILICLIWTIPTIGLLISSFRTRDDLQTTGWWQIFPHREWVVTKEFVPNDGQDRTGVMNYEGVSGTFQELREGVANGDTRIQWIGNRRTGRIQVQQREWKTRAD